MAPSDKGELSLRRGVRQATLENTIILFACPPKFCISIVFVFSWDYCKSKEKLETMLMQNLVGQTKRIMVFSKVAYKFQPSVIKFPAVLLC